MSGSSSFLGMSDEDFLKENGPTVETLTEPAAEPVAAAESVEVTPTAPETTTSDRVVGESTADESPTTDETPGEAPAETPDYEAFYKQILAPFKANGKTIELRTSAEAVQLMQMGANYTRKMQELAPHRKVLLMLENNGLLDEGKLSFLIDIEKKNPEAIKKLLKDAGIDPQEIDTSVESAYREGNHRVTNEEASFQTALDSMQSNPAGSETLQVIHTSWDQASKEVLWKSPEIMEIIHQQRENGIYARISSEIDRQRILGVISSEVPFLQAYRTVGDKMVQANAFADLLGDATTSSTSALKTSPTLTGATAPVVVATNRAAAPKAALSNGDRASAASSTRTVPVKAQVVVNPLAMSDDEFMKQMASRN